jgi:hypothetical protein
MYYTRFLIELTKIAAEEKIKQKFSERHPVLAYVGIPAAIGATLAAPIAFALTRDPIAGLGGLIGGAVRGATLGLAYLGGKTLYEKLKQQ